MTWEELSLVQIKAVLLEGRPEYRALRGTLRERLRDKNIEERNNHRYPLAFMAYALAVLAVWHAASEGREAGLDYLEEHYHLKKLFWDKEHNPRDFDLSQYLTMSAANRPARTAPYAEQRACAAQCLRRIRDTYAQEAFHPDMTFGELLDWAAQANRMGARGGEERAIFPYLEPLREVLGVQLPAGVFPAQQPQQPRQAPEPPFPGEVRGLLENGVKLIVLTGAPGTGKTYAAKALARELGTPLPGPRGTRPYALVQFHPSYDYTDFVEGLRPIQAGNEMPLVKLDGSFKAFCRQVVRLNRECAERGEDPLGRRYFFLIDEINRAELSKVFGELMSCLEADKRGPGQDGQNRVQTQYQNLPTYDLEAGRMLTPAEDVFADGFYVPENVYIIGTMNDIDRSVESMDFALRRRFDLREVVVDAALLGSAFAAMGFGRNTDGLTCRVTALNRTIEAEGGAYGLNRQYFIAQGHFASLPGSIRREGPLEEILEYVWAYRLETLLREYLRGVNGAKADAFVSKCRDAFLRGDNAHEDAQG